MVARWNDKRPWLLCRAADPRKHVMSINGTQPCSTINRFLHHELKLMRCSASWFQDYGYDHIK